MSGIRPCLIAIGPTLPSQFSLFSVFIVSMHSWFLISRRGVSRRHVREVGSDGRAILRRNGADSHQGLEERRVAREMRNRLDSCQSRRWPRMRWSVHHHCATHLQPTSERVSFFLSLCTAFIFLSFLPPHYSNLPFFFVPWSLSFHSFLPPTSPLL